MISLPSGFWFRRFARLIPCVFRNVGGGFLALRSKWEVASARDVFLSAHYWRMFDHIKQAPSLVLDLGAHCGHFMVVCETITVEKFGFIGTRYIAVEPLEEMISLLRSVMSGIGATSRLNVVKGLVGQRCGGASVFSSTKSRMDTSIFQANAEMQMRGESVSYVDLEALVPAEADVDILKLDIEGAEYDFIDAYSDLLRRTRMLAVELHPIEGKSMDTFIASLYGMGFKSCSSPIMKPDGCRLLLLDR